jgi:hypothetical protein
MYGVAVPVNVHVKVVNFPAPEKFNTFNTFNTFAVVTLARDHMTLVPDRRCVTDPSQSAPSPCHPPFLGATGRVPAGWRLGSEGRSTYPFPHRLSPA